MASAYRVLGQAAPSTTANVDICTVGAAKQLVISTMHVCNTTSSAVTARVFARIAGAAAAASNALAYDVSIPANSIFAMTEGWTFNATDVITVQSSVANALTFTLFGSEIS
jgi:hypothetical protein